MRPFASRRAREWSTAVLLLSLFFGAVSASTHSLAAEAGKRAGRKGKKKAKAAAESGVSPGEPNLANVPLPVGHDAKGLVLPDFDLQGHLRGKFVAGVARRIDQDHIAFDDLKITTFNEQNAVDLQINMRTSVLDLKTRILSSREQTTVRRADFNIVGDSAVFDTNTHIGHLIGNVRMVINDKSHLIQKPNP
jgi:hypothetical protein